jgi:hypothetical protein
MLGSGSPAQMRILVVGCEPENVGYGMELSGPVAAAVDEAVGVVLGLVAEAGRDRQDAENPDAETPGAETPGGGNPRAESAGAQNTGAVSPLVPEATGEGASYVPWHPR